jgi:hypothetical protein
MPESTHHQSKKCRRQAPWRSVPEVYEWSPSMQKTSMVGPLGGSSEGLGAPTIDTEKF